jgi:hypothetical protein
MPLLLGEVMSLVNTDDTSATAAYMVQDSFGHLEANPQTLEAGCARSA